MSLYKDASLVMIPSAVKDGKLYSIRPTPEYGAELVTNGTFDSDSDWDKGTGWTISGGTANCNGTNDTAIEQNISSSNTTLKRITFSVSNYVSGTLRVYSGSGADVFLNVTANGTYELESYLIANKQHRCILCDKELPLCLLETAHIKPRCILNNTEMNDINVVEFMCRYCHNLYDRGFLGVHKGILEQSSLLDLSKFDIKYER